MKILTRKQASGLGLKRYFNGVACANGHLADRLVSNATCTACAKTRGKRHYQDNKKIYIDRAKKFYAENTIEVTKKIKLWASLNREKVNAYSATYRHANQKLCNARTSAWVKANPELMRIKEHSRRARKLANGGVLSVGLAAKLFKLQKGKCPCCGLPLGINYHMDHITSLIKGGANEDWNIQLLRQRCNNQKHARDPIEFMQSRGKLI